jgi:hypothetical protein
MTKEGDTIPDLRAGRVRGQSADETDSEGFRSPTATRERVDRPCVGEEWTEYPRDRQAASSCPDPFEARGTAAVRFARDHALRSILAGFVSYVGRETRAHSERTEHRKTNPTAIAARNREAEQV